MAPPTRSRPQKRNELAAAFKPAKATLFSESVGRPSSLIQGISCVAWSPTGTLLATCTSASIRIWNAERPNVKSSLDLKNAHAKGGAAFGSPGVSGDKVEKVAFCPTVEGVLASSGRDGMVRLWDVRVPGGVANVGGKGTALADCRTGGDGDFLTWHPNGREILLGRRDDQVYSIDVRQMASADSTPTYTLEPTERIHKRSGEIYFQMAFSNSGREVFATTKDGPVQILDYPSMTLLHTLSAHPQTTHTVQHSPAGTYIAVGSADSTISLWDTHTWFCTHTFSSQTQQTSVKDLSFSFDGAYLIAGSGDMAKEGGAAGLPIYHVDTGEVVHTVETLACPTHVAWHPTRYWIAYAGDPGGLKVVSAVGGSI